MRFEDALRDLDARQPESMPGPSLDRIRALCELLDHPERTYPSFQVTGTNGKTTTTRLVTALACAHGLSTGAFISPHLSSVTERISLCGEPISPEEFAEEYRRLLPFLERVDGAAGRVTYFEALTALAYLWFADRPAAAAVFEVGMGGSWDATNLARGEVAVLCPVGLDHVRELGPTVEAIAGEKAGIVKEGAVAVVRRQRPEAMAMIERRCAEVGATLVAEGPDFAVERRSRAVGGQILSVSSVHGRYDEVFLPLFGEQAGRNAAAAVAATEAFLGRALDGAAVRASLGAVSVPGRLEVVSRRPMVVLDGAHNADAAAALAEALEEFARERLHLVVGVFADKDVRAVLEPLVPLAASVYACRSSSPRAAPPAEVAAVARDLGASDVRVHPGVAEAVAEARGRANSADLILITGSFYTVADARPPLVGA